MKLLLDYRWPGNLYQIENFCQRLILTAPKRSLDEWAVKRLLWELYGKEETENGADGKKGEERMGSFRPENQQSKQLYETLIKYGGNRKKTAEALGISKATLWRQMKKYGLE